jgi:hypothetical protein
MVPRFGGLRPRATPSCTFPLVVSLLAAFGDAAAGDASSSRIESAHDDKSWAESRTPRLDLRERVVLRGHIRGRKWSLCLAGVGAQGGRALATAASNAATTRGSRAGAQRRCGTSIIASARTSRAELVASSVELADGTPNHRKDHRSTSEGGRTNDPCAGCTVRGTTVLQSTTTATAICIPIGQRRGPVCTNSGGGGCGCSAAMPCVWWPNDCENERRDSESVPGMQDVAGLPRNPGSQPRVDVNL